MTDLEPTTALGADRPRSFDGGALRIAETPGLALASLALAPGRAGDPPALAGLDLPGPGRWVRGDGLSAFWTGPGQWMIEGEDRAGEDFAAVVARAAPEAAVTEQTDGWVAFEIASSGGPGPLEALTARLANIDVAGFGAGRATRTVVHHVGCHLVRRADDRLAVIAPRSYAASVWHALETAAARLAVSAPGG